MMGDIKLKIRHAKRGNEKQLDLSGFGISELPTDLLQLTMLEVLIVSNNKLTSLRKVESLPNLRVIDASNNNITSLHQEMLDNMYSLDTLYLFGNPLVNQNPALAKIEGNQPQLRKALEQYFGGGSSSLGISSGGFGGGAVGAGGSLTSNFQGMSLQQQAPSTTFGKSFGGPSMGTAPVSMAPSVSSASFLQSDINDPAALRKRIADLEAENKRLKEAESAMGSKGGNTLRAGNPTGDKDWMNFGSAPLERPTTASTTQQVKSLQEELKMEKKEKKYMLDEIENLKKEL